LDRNLASSLLGTYYLKTNPFKAIILDSQTKIWVSKLDVAGKGWTFIKGNLLQTSNYHEQRPTYLSVDKLPG